MPPMRPNGSTPPAEVIPELGHAGVGEAVAWLVEVFGFEERLRIAKIADVDPDTWGGALVGGGRAGTR